MLPLPFFEIILVLWKKNIEKRLSIQQKKKNFYQVFFSKSSILIQFLLPTIWLVGSLRFLLSSKQTSKYWLTTLDVIHTNFNNIRGESYHLRSRFNTYCVIIYCSDSCDCIMTKTKYWEVATVGQPRCYSTRGQFSKRLLSVGGQFYWVQLSWENELPGGIIS